MRNKSPLTLYAFLFSICISLFSITETIAQENGIYELNENNSFSKESSKKDKKNNRESFYNLVYNLHATHYIENNTLKVTYDFGDPVKMTFEDSKSLNWLKNKSSKKDAIELITISLNDVNDLNNVLDLTNSSELNNLKYVFIKCNFNCSESDIEKYIKAKDKVRIFYTIQKPS